MYPLPEEGGLGVHLTLDLQGAAKFGPDVQWVDSVDYTVDGRSAEAFYSAIRTYWPGLPNGALKPSFAGIRPKVWHPGAAKLPAACCLPASELRCQADVKYRHSRDWTMLQRVCLVSLGLASASASASHVGMHSCHSFMLNAVRYNTS